MKKQIRIRDIKVTTFRTSASDRLGTVIEKGQTAVEVWLNGDVESRQIHPNVLVMVEV